MEAPLHHSPVPLPAPEIMAPPPPPPRQYNDAIGAAVLQEQAAAVSAVMVAQKPPPLGTTVTGREQCPRCASRDTKFCYYNNYNTAQPRHFCRACRRYWTLGGSLRNVPIGGSTRKRPRPARLSTRAVAAAAASATTIAATATSCGPFASSSPAVAAPLAPATARSGGGLLSSLLLGPAAPLLPVLEGRLGCFNLGLGQPAAAGSTTGAGDLAQLGFGAVPLPPWAPTTVLEGDRAETTTWKSGGAFPPAAAALWQELAAAMPQAGAGATPLLL